MKSIAQKIWLEPAAFLGLLTTIALAVGAVLTGSDWNWETIVAILAPLVSSLGIRRKVAPVEADPAPDPAPTRLAKPGERL